MFGSTVREPGRAIRLETESATARIEDRFLSCTGTLHGPSSRVYFVAGCIVKPLGGERARRRVNRMLQTFYIALRSLCASGAVAAMCLSLNAQVRVTGRVSSDTGTPVPNAAVVIREASSHDRFRTLTDPTGAFSAALSTPGNYFVSGEANGYFALKEQAIALAAGDNELNLTMAPLSAYVFEIKSK